MQRTCTWLFVVLVFPGPPNGNVLLVCSFFLAGDYLRTRRLGFCHLDGVRSRDMYRFSRQFEAETCRHTSLIDINATCGKKKHNFLSVYRLGWNFDWLYSYVFKHQTSKIVSLVSPMDPRCRRLSTFILATAMKGIKSVHIAFGSSVDGSPRSDRGEENPQWRDMKWLVGEEYRVFKCWRLI